MLHCIVLGFFSCVRLLCDWAVHACFVHEAGGTATSHHQHLLVIKQLRWLVKECESNWIVFWNILWSNIFTKVIDWNLSGVPTTFESHRVFRATHIVHLLASSLRSFKLFINCWWWVRVLISWGYSCCWPQTIRRMSPFSAVSLIYYWCFWILNKIFWYFCSCFILTRWPPSSISDLSIRDIIIKFLIVFMHCPCHNPLNLIQFSLLLNHSQSLRITHIDVVAHLSLLLLLLRAVMIHWIVLVLLVLLHIIWAEWAIWEGATVLMPLFNHLLARHNWILVLNQFFLSEFHLISSILLLSLEHLRCAYWIASIRSLVLVLLLYLISLERQEFRCCLEWS